MTQTGTTEKKYQLYKQKHNNNKENINGGLLK